MAAYRGGLRQTQVRLAESRRNEAQTAPGASNIAALREVAVAWDRVQTGLSRYDAAVVPRSTAKAAFDQEIAAFPAYLPLLPTGRM
jgi:outer membrane protein TolC